MQIYLIYVINLYKVLYAYNIYVVCVTHLKKVYLPGLHVCYTPVGGIVCIKHLPGLCHTPEEGIFTWIVLHTCRRFIYLVDLFDRMTGQENTCQLLGNKGYPDLIFSRVRSYTSSSEIPLL